MVLFAPALALGQGVRMSPDFLPLDVGNRWEYAIVSPEGTVLDTFEMEITGYTIIEGTSYYVFSGFQFVGASGPIGVRFDRDQRQYLRFDGESETDLFPAARTSVEVVETDANNVPLKARFDFGDLALVLERSVGIVEGELTSASGPQAVKLVGALIGNESVVGDVEVRGAAPLIRAVDPVQAVGEVSEASVRLAVDATADAEGHRFSFRIQNISGQLLGFDFNSSQSFDFVVVNSENGSEVWRWSDTRFFSDVLRSEALRAGLEWNYEAVWNHRDKDFNEVSPGTYRVIAVLTTDPPVESAPLEFQLP